MVCILSGPEKVRAFDFGTVRRFVEKGKPAVVSLNVYAAGQSLQIETVRQPQALQVEIVCDTDLTKGMAVGQRINWYGTEPADDPKKVIKFHQTVTGLPESKNFKLIARSCANKQAAFVEQRIGEGRVFALDLLSLNGSAGYDAGSKNKWGFPGNILGGSVRYSPYRSEKLAYSAFVDLMKGIVQKHKGRIERKEVARARTMTRPTVYPLASPMAPASSSSGPFTAGSGRTPMPCST